MYCKKQSRLYAYIPALVAFVCACFYFLFHFHFMQQFLDWDQVWYTNNIKNMLRGSTPYFNPHHLHYETGGMLFHEFMIEYFKNQGFTDVLFNSRLRSLLFACTGLFFIILYLKEITGKLMWGIIGGFMTAFCHGYLAYSTQADTPIFPASAFCVMLYIIYKIEHSKHPLPWSFAGGIACAASIILHQYSALGCVAAFISIILPPFIFKISYHGSPLYIKKRENTSCFTQNHITRYKAVIIMVFTGIIFAGGAYFYSGKTVFNLPFNKPDRRGTRGRYWYTTFPKWLFLYQAEGWWARGFNSFDIRRPFRGYTNGFLSPTTSYKYFRYNSLRFKYKITKPGDKKSFAYNQVAYLTIIPLAGIFIFFPFFWKRYSRGLVFLLSSFFIYSIFTAYWEASYFEFWLIPCLSSCIIGVLFLNFLGEKLQYLFKRTGQIPVYVIALIFFIALSSHNVLYYVIPYSRSRHMEDIDRNWKREYYWGLFNDSVYKYPENPYKALYSRKPVR